MPTVAIASPASGATIAGTITVSGSASDNVAVSKVELRVDGNAYQLMSGTTSWTFSLNTSADAKRQSHPYCGRPTRPGTRRGRADRDDQQRDRYAGPSGDLESGVGGDDLGDKDRFRTASDNVAVSKVESGWTARPTSGERDDLVVILAEHNRLLQRQAHPSCGRPTLREPGVGEQTVTVSNGTSGSTIYWGAWTGRRHWLSAEGHEWAIAFEDDR